MSDLTNFVNEADKKSAFVKFEDGEPMVVTFLDAALVDDKFNPGQKTMEYTIEVNGGSKTFNSKSAALARQMVKFEPGTEVEITKEGAGFKTKWFVNKVKKTG